MRRTCAVLALVALGACAGRHKEPEVRTVTVNVPVAVSCVPPGLPPRPTYPDTEAALRAAPGAAERYVLMGAGRLLRKQRLAEIEPVIEACR